MDRNQQAAGVNLLDREDRIIADVLERFRNLVIVATGRITNKTSTGQAAYRSMAMELETQSLIKAIEDLLALTRQLRELWVVGPLRKPGEDREAEEQIDTEVQRVVQLLNQLRESSRQKLVAEQGGFGQYIHAPVEIPKPAQAATNTQATQALQ